MLGNFFKKKFVGICFFFSKSTFLKNEKIENIKNKRQTVWIHIRPNTLSALIWVETVCKDCKKMRHAG